MTPGGAKGTKASNRRDAPSRRFIFRTACKNQVVLPPLQPRRVWNSLHLGENRRQRGGNGTGGQGAHNGSLFDLERACHLCRQRQQRPETVHHLAHWRRRFREGGGGYTGVRFLIHSFIHSLTHSLVHPFTRLVVAPLAAPPVPAYTCARRPGHAFCYMLPVWRCNSFHTPWNIFW